MIPIIRKSLVDEYKKFEYYPQNLLKLVNVLFELISSQGKDLYHIKHSTFNIIRYAKILSRLKMELKYSYKE